MINGRTKRHRLVHQPLHDAQVRDEVLQKRHSTHLGGPPRQRCTHTHGTTRNPADHESWPRTLLQSPAWFAALAIRVAPARAPPAGPPPPGPRTQAARRKHKSCPTCDHAAYPSSSSGLRRRGTHAHARKPGLRQQSLPHSRRVAPCLHLPSPRRTPSGAMCARACSPYSTHDGRLLLASWIFLICSGGHAHPLLLKPKHIASCLLPLATLLSRALRLGSPELNHRLANVQHTRRTPTSGAGHTAMPIFAHAPPVPSHLVSYSVCADRHHFSPIASAYAPQSFQRLSRNAFLGRTLHVPHMPDEL